MENHENPRKTKDNLGKSWITAARVAEAMREKKTIPKFEFHVLLHMPRTYLSQPFERYTNYGVGWQFLDNKLRATLSLAFPLPPPPRNHSICLRMPESETG